MHCLFSIIQCKEKLLITPFLQRCILFYSSLKLVAGIRLFARGNLNCFCGYFLLFLRCPKPSWIWASDYVRVVPKIPNPTKKTKKLGKTIFINIVSIWPDTLFSEMFNSFYILYKVRTVDLLKIAINCKLHLFIVCKPFTTKLLFEFWTRK